jgi:hypothetical protein
LGLEDDHLRINLFSEKSFLSLFEEMEPFYLILILVIILVILILFLVFCLVKKPKTRTAEAMLSYVRKMYEDLAPNRNVTVNQGKSAYTKRKKNVYLCLEYPKGSGRYYDRNTLSFVALHELAHVIDKNVTVNEEHSDEFNVIFAFLLQKAQEKGYFDKGKPIAKNYCGIQG